MVKELCNRSAFGESTVVLFESYIAMFREYFQCIVKGVKMRAPATDAVSVCVCVWRAQSEAEKRLAVIARRRLH